MALQPRTAPAATALSSLTASALAPPSPSSAPRRFLGDLSSLWHVFTSATVFGGISAALTQALWGYLRMRNENKPREIRTYVKNISRALSERFVPPQRMRWGPVFSNPAWRDQFQELVTDDMYHVYYGSSQTGKSLAICHALGGYTGVTFLSLRGIPDDEVWSEFAHAINFHGNRTGADVPGAMLLRAYTEACERWKLRNPGKRPILIIEDLSGLQNGVQIGPQMAAFSARLVRLYQKGVVNVVYTISNFPTVTALRTVSGHARIGAELFPPIPDQVLIDQITTLALPKDPNSEEFVYPFKDCATHIVQTLGSHMSDITNVLRAVHERHKNYQDALEGVVRANVDQLRLALLGDPQILGQADAETFVVAAHHLLRLLTLPSAPNNGAVRWGAVQDAYPSVDTGMLFMAIKQLVEACIFTFVDGTTVQLYSRSLRTAYSKYLANDPDVLRVEASIKRYFSATDAEAERREGNDRRLHMLASRASSAHSRRAADMSTHIVEAPPPNVKSVGAVTDDPHSHQN